MRSTIGKFFVVILFLTISVGLGSRLATAPAFGQSEPASKSEVDLLKGEIEKLGSEVQSLRGEVKIIREYMLRGGPVPSQGKRIISTVRVLGNPVLGKADAPITMIEFSDYECPFCSKYSRSTLPAIKAEYIDTGKLKYVFRDFPIDRIHPQARKAAEAAHCAGDQGKYWKMHDLLFGNQKALQVDKLKAYARRLDLDPKAFADCLEKRRHAAKVQKNYEDGVTAGVRGTPSFFLGKTSSDDKIKGVLISGARPIKIFRQAIERLLKEN